MPSTTHLLKTRRFLPLFVAQFLGAFNNNLFKNAVIVLAAYGLAEQHGVDPETLAALAGGLFILPFVLFSATSGQFADRYEKARLIRISKLAEVLCMAVAAAGLMLENLPLMLAALFLLGTQAAFFGTLKYSILPTQLKEGELIGGNGLMEAGTFLAILGGMMTGGLLVAQAGATSVAMLGIAVAIIGWSASFGIPEAPVTKNGIRVEANIARATWEMFRYTLGHKEIARLLPGIAWFWLMGSVLLTQLPAFVKNTLHGNAQVVTLCLTLFSIGIAAGSMLCNRLLKGRVSAAIAPLGAIGMGVFTLGLMIAGVVSDIFTCGLGGAMPFIGTSAPCTLQGIGEFLSFPANWGVMLCLLMISLSGGIYIVPLQAMLQMKTEEHHRARMVAASNMMSSLFMVLGSVMVVAMLAAGLTLMHILITLAALNVMVALYARRLK